MVSLELLLSVVMNKHQFENNIAELESAIGHLWKIEIVASHSVFEGHFPKEPVWPGVLLLDEVLRKLVELGVRQDLVQYSIEYAKFMNVVKPGDKLEFTLRKIKSESGAEIYKSSIHNYDRKPVAKFTLDII